MYWLTLSNFAPSCPRIAAYLEERFVDLGAPGGHTHTLAGSLLRNHPSLLSAAKCPTPHSSRSQPRPLSGFLPSSSPFAGSRKGEATAV